MWIESQINNIIIKIFKFKDNKSNNFSDKEK
jgi:hypothetical protein